MEDRVSASLTKGIGPRSGPARSAALRRRRPGAWILLGFLPLLIPAASLAQAPWDEPLFSVEAEKLARGLADRPVPEESGCEVLLQETVVRIDDDGCQETVTRTVVRCITKAGAEAEGVMGAIWSPWYQERPEFRARVVTREGDEYELDPRNVSESAIGESHPGVFSDRRILQAPLPGVRRGCLIEWEIVHRDKRPFFENGTIGHMDFTPSWPTRKMRLVVESPADLPLRFHAHRTDITPTERIEEGRRIVVHERESFPWPVEFPVLLPPEKSGLAQVAYSTGRSWREVARGYAALIGEKLDADAVKELVERTVEEGMARDEAIDRLLREAQRLVRYTDVEFGASSIVPALPRETVDRGFGDCKDQAALLVAMLRAAGYEAHVALVRTGYGRPVWDDLPGLNAFDHAIVHVSGEPALWIDPTSEYTRLGDLPAMDQGCKALIVANETEGLVPTPKPGSEENTYRETFRIELADWGGARLVQKLESTGTIEQEMRANYGAATPAELRETWEEHVTGAWKASSLEKLEFGDPHDFSAPFRVQATSVGAAALGITEGAEASVSLGAGSIVDRLPFWFRWGSLVDDEDEEGEG